MSEASSDVLLERLMQLHPKLIDLSLERMMRLLKALDNPHLKLPPVVHVAGTNGKGSAIAYMRAALLAAGYRVHVYTSPHLVRFHERVEIDGKIIAEDDLADLLDDCERANGGEPITFFEVTTAAAFLGFSRTPADILLMETGLGGRLDATNVIDRPLLSVITLISLDHQQFLGETLAEIAGEKAGIIKPGVPVVIGPQEPAGRDVLLVRAEELGAPALMFGRDFAVDAVSAEGFSLSVGSDRMEMPDPVLAGPHQPSNAATAITALRHLAGFELDEEHLRQGLRTARWPARMQQLHHGALKDKVGPDVELWLDGGHNPAAGQVLADMAGTWNDRPLDIVVGMMNTKDPAGFIAPLAPFVRRAVAVGIPGEKNTLSAGETRAVLDQAGVETVAAGDFDEALGLLRASGKGSSRILICGSLYLAGRVLAAND
ncbi:MAG: bifunctional folylpolyglutamate synthase/dihydrofolate synthase [Alphaproteobacteria bacterium]|nr:bifunctional folylpolyglutamate synthase/dihydrofolate synthase [Alphaproteobacteria bacterium]